MNKKIKLYKLRLEFTGAGKDKAQALQDWKESLDLDDIAPEDLEIVSEEEIDE